MGRLRVLGFNGQHVVPWATTWGCGECTYKHFRGCDDWIGTELMLKAWFFSLTL